MTARAGRSIDIGDTEIWVREVGAGYPLVVLHGGPGLDHTMFGDYLDPLGNEYRLVLIDQRGHGRSGRPPAETWTLEQMAADIDSLTAALGFDEYAVLGHSYGALVVLQHAVDHPGSASQTIISSGFPSARFLQDVQANLEVFEPIELREQVRRSWEKESEITRDEELHQLLDEQEPFHFADPLDPRIKDYQERTSGGIYSAAMLKHFATQDYGGIEVVDRLPAITEPVLVLAGRHDRACSAAASELMAERIPDAELVVFENSAHMSFVEEQDLYLKTVREFLRAHARVRN